MVRNRRRSLIIIFIFMLISIDAKVVKGNECISVDLIEKYSKYNTYINERYGFSIEYPSELIPSEPSTNNDGMYFSNIDKTVELIVWGSNNIEADSAETLYKHDMQYIPKDNHTTWCNGYAYNLTWHDNKYMYHKYSIVGKGSINTFTFKSPIENKELYEYVIERLDKSFNAPLVNQCC